MRLKGFMALLLAVGFAAAAPAQAPPTVRIGAWNIEHLGFKDSRSGPARGIAQTPEDLADYIKASGVEVLALEEVGDTDGNPNTRTNVTLTAAFNLIRQQTGQEWKHLLYVKPNPNEKTQLLGLAWNTGKVTQVGEPFKIPVPNQSGGQDIWKRHPHAVKVSFGEGKTDVVLISVHLKANTGGGVAANRLRRKEEAKTLMQVMGQVRQHFTDQDIVVLGDFNMLNHDEPAGQAFDLGGFDDLNATDMPTTFRGPAPFDRFMVPTDQQADGKEFEDSRQDVFDDEFLQPRNLTRVDFKKRFSDHFMVTTTVKVMADDD